MYKLVAIDMDGTLLNEKKEISQENYDMIQKAREQGKKVVIATGRPLIGIISHLNNLNLVSDEDYVVAYNGSLVQTTKSGKVVSQASLSREDYKELYDLSQECGVHIHALTDKEVITPVYNKYTQVEADINDIPIEVMGVEDVPDGMPIIKAMFIDDPEKLDKALEMLPQAIKDKYNILRSAPFFLEFLHKSANKGTGVKAVADALGYSAEEVICIGDAGNDLAMVEYAGLGVAMDNAFPELKDAADYITKSNEDHGVAHVIEKFMLGEEVA